MMTQKELLNLAECYIVVEGYTDLRSIQSVMSQEYPGEFDRKQAIQTIHEALKASTRVDTSKCRAESVNLLR